MSIVLIRHGETAGNFERALQRADTPLNETGLRQAELVGARLKGLAPEHLMTSDHPRARMTAEVIARHTGLTVEVTPLLQERSLGDWRGRPYSEFTDFHPLSPDVDPPNGETWVAFHARVRDAFALIVQRRAPLPGPLLVVTHGLVLRSIFEGPLGVPHPEAFGNTSVSILEPVAPHAATLLNCTRHLDARTRGAKQ